MLDIEKPIFLHSWFRSGSTYLWSKFRSLEDVICYYEPLHEKIAKLDNPAATDPASASMVNKLRHPVQEKDYFHEYQSLKKTITFNQSISYDRYLLNENGNDRELKNYIGQLIEHAQLLQKKPVLSFCRSQLRSAWMRKNFEAIHIATIRNPLDQWSSFNVDWYFIDKVFRISHSIHLFIPGLFKPVPKYHQFLLTIGRQVPSDIHTYPVRQFSHEEVFSIFLIVWLISSLHAVNTSHYAVDIDELSRSEVCRSDFAAYLAKLNINLSFEDCKIPKTVSETSNHGKLEQHLKGLISYWSPEIRRALSDVHVSLCDRDKHNTISDLCLKLLNSVD